MNKEYEAEMMKATDLNNFMIEMFRYQYLEDQWSDELKAFYAELIKKPRPLYGDLRPNRNKQSPK